MTVHKAKGLEFPIVVLADMTAKLRAAAASRFVDPDRRVSAIRLAGCSPLELIEHEAEELQRDDAEGVRVAYVAATRARDLLVVPAVGDQPRDGWIEPLNGAIYPPAPARRRAQRAPGCPPFRTTDSVVSRPNGDPAGAETVCPGLHTWSEGHHVVWWDPHILALGAEPPLGIKRPELIVKDVAPRVVEAGLAEYEAWRVRHESSVAAGAQPAIAVRTATAWARNPDQSDSVRLKPDTTDTNIGVETLPVGSAFRRTALPPVETIDLTAAEKRPTGRRFGTLVHAVLASVSLDADEVIDGLAMTHGRVLGATDEEVGAVTGIVRRVLAHPFLHRARAAAAAGRCRREVPIALRDGDRSLIEGVIDLAFEEEDGWTVIDFKTDEELQSASAAYERQTGLYAAALRLVSGRPVKPFIMHV
jgi:ATP-dependent exoDNAse (exonuclease V) beta subunit